MKILVHFTIDKSVQTKVEPPNHKTWFCVKSFSGHQKSKSKAAGLILKRKIWMKFKVIRNKLPNYPRMRATQPCSSPESKLSILFPSKLKYNILSSSTHLQFKHKSFSTSSPTKINTRKWVRAVLHWKYDSQLEKKLKYILVNRKNRRVPFIFQPCALAFKYFLEIGRDALTIVSC